MDQVWPTEKSATDDSSGTKYLEPQITESPDIFGSTAAETVGLPIETTCFYVVLKNERKRARAKRDARRREGSLRLPASSVRPRDRLLENVTSERTLRSKKPKRSADGGNTRPKLDEFPDTGDGPSTMRGRKLCGIGENKLKRRTVKHKKSTRNAKCNGKKAKSAEPQKSRVVDSHAPRVREAGSRVVDKKNPDHRRRIVAKASVDHHIRVEDSDNGESEGKLSRHDVAVADRRNKSAPGVGKTRGCADCICDISDVIDRVKSVLDGSSYPLDEIKALNCSRFKETREKIVISVDSDVEEDARAFPQPRYNTESLKGQKYIKPQELGADPRGDLPLENDRDIISLPGLNLNVPCNRDGDGVTWLSSVGRPSYTWKRADGIALYGFVAENGDLELRNVNARDTGNYTCVVTYTGADNEEPVEATYEVRLRVVTLPRYILHGESRYRVRFCDERGLDALTTYLPLKLNNVLCEADICNAYVLTPSCSRNQITMNVLIVPSHIVKLTTIDHKRCNVFCLKAIQDKLSLVLSKNLQIFLEKTIIFRLLHFEQKLVPIVEKPSLARRRRGENGESELDDAFGDDVGLFSSCPAGYGLRGTHCVPCDVDTYSEDGVSRCKKCPPGTYQPNHGARVCRTCTSPLTRGCYNMLWNSFSAVMMTLASLSVMLSIFLLLLWLVCCAKKKFCAKRIISVVSDEGALLQEKHVEEEPLIKDVSENEDQLWDGEYRIKKKRGKFSVNRKRRKQSEKRYEKTHEDEWGSHRIMDAPVNGLDSYRSHEDYNNHYPKQSHRKGPRLPERDFDT
ncbi:PREDICTED: uncharacterized protein LOC106744571 [Dinoponera quadriceps]|uniref:Uncharacterized protein LOC106744571 n=1 Tax=Dinoponera quadriceps TaxID=609295 RepID=A0A6P3X9M1_DINQU|nr:PREDICTED: uncharacterized protein LOC106744571 [Dinoponera quadriceps]